MILNEVVGAKTVTPLLLRKRNNMEMKAIAWLDNIIVIGANTLIEIKEAKVTVNKGIDFVYAEHQQIAKRATEDKIFGEMLQYITRKSIASFLLSDEVILLDLAQTMLNTKIEQATTNEVPKNKE